MQLYRYCSDLHGQMAFVSDPRDKDTILLVAGDIMDFGKKGIRLVQMIEELCSRFKLVVHIPGNHEFYGTNLKSFCLKMYKLTAHLENYRLLQNESLVIDGVKIIGSTLWSDVTMIHGQVMSYLNDYRWIRNGPSTEPWRRRLHSSDIITEFMRSKYFIECELKEWEGDCIVVTHHAPSYLSVSAKYVGDKMNAAFATELELNKWPNYWIHGHIHTVSSYILNGCNVLCNPVGHPSESFTGYTSIYNYFYL